MALQRSEVARRVSLSKRRRGLFNKANELAVLCGAEVAAVAFSPGGKPFAYGYPSVRSVLDRFHPSNPPAAQAAAAVGGGDGNQELEELNQELGELRALVDAEKARKKAAEQALAEARAKRVQGSVWGLDADVSKMGEEDLLAFSVDLAKVVDGVAASDDEVLQLQGEQQIMMAILPPPGYPQ